MKNIFTYYELFCYILICQLIGILGSFYNIQAIPDWYVTLTHPSFTPPNWVFAPMWVTLYTLIGIAWFILKNTEESAHRRSALDYFYIQLLLNGLWSPIFFGAKEIDIALIISGAMIITIALTMIHAWKVQRLVTYLFIPYLLWVCYAFAINLGFSLLN